MSAEVSTSRPARPDGADGADGADVVEIGAVHGRFQPFHLGHLEYVQHAAARCRTLIVGITNADPTWWRHTPQNPQRSQHHANPFPYWLRERLIDGALREAGIDADRFRIVPFPIHDPTLVPDYVPPGARHYLRVFSSWEQRKVDDLRAAGHDVEVLDPGVPKHVTATEVRRRLRTGGDWRALVPPAAALVLQASQHPDVPPDGPRAGGTS